MYEPPKYDEGNDIIKCSKIESSINKELETRDILSNYHISNDQINLILKSDKEELMVYLADSMQENNQLLERIKSFE